jgi:hypothetical protein
MKLLPLLLILAASCKSPQILTETIRTDSTIIREIPKIITIPGQSAQSPGVNLDSLVKVIQSGISPQVINRTLTYTDPETNMRVGLLLDELGNLSALCESQEHTITLLEKEIERIRTTTTNTTITKKPSLWQTLYQNIQFILIILGIAVIFFVVRRK